MRRCSPICARPARRAHAPKSTTISLATSASVMRAPRSSTWPTRVSLGKVSLPARLTRKSNVEVQELAFVYLAASATRGIAEEARTGAAD